MAQKLSKRLVFDRESAFGCNVASTLQLARYLLNYLFTSLQLLHTLCAQYYKMKQVDATDVCQTPSAITFSVNHFNL